MGTSGEWWQMAGTVASADAVRGGGAGSNTWLDGLGDGSTRRNCRHTSCLDLLGGAGGDCHDMCRKPCHPVATRAADLGAGDRSSGPVRAATCLGLALRDFKQVSLFSQAGFAGHLLRDGKT